MMMVSHDSHVTVTKLFVGNPKIKLYRDSNGELKGDGLCCYLKVESVKLALDLLDESDLKGHKISVKKV